uniref:Uncharacterized protein n=1 Tax=Rhizophora mucronata TaxID=61149 RepID=A0A2P2JD79_RHIMU
MGCPMSLQEYKCGTQIFHAYLSHACKRISHHSQQTHKQKVEPLGAQPSHVY